MAVVGGQRDTVEGESHKHGAEAEEHEVGKQRSACGASGITGLGEKSKPELAP